MKVHPMYALFLCLFILLFPHKAWSSGNDPLKIKFHSTSYIHLSLANVMEPFTLQLEYYPNLSRAWVSTPAYNITKDTTLLLAITTHMAQRQTLKAREIGFPVFLAIGDTTDITLDLKRKKIDYDGKYKALNDYYHSVYKQYNIHQNKMVELHTSESTPWELVYEAMDSLAEIETGWLRNTPVPLPKWFIELELKRIEFHTAHFKLSGPNYRNFLSKANEQEIPRMELYDFTKELDLQSSYNQYLGEFYRFMNFFAFHKIYGRYAVVYDSVVQLFNKELLATRMFEVFEGDVDPGNLAAFQVANTLRDINKNSVRKGPRLKYISEKHGEDSKYIAYLRGEDDQIKRIGLKKGDKAPGFYLDNGLEEYHTLEQYRGKIVLLNFYTRGCKPCFKEVPYEKELLKKYEGKAFEIINICVTNDPEEFELAVKKFDMRGVTLYTQGNWKKSLPGKYSLHGYPHYALIDKEGKIIMNHAFRPSDPQLEKLVDSYL